MDVAYAVVSSVLMIGSLVGAIVWGRYVLAPDQNRASRRNRLHILAPLPIMMAFITMVILMSISWAKVAGTSPNCGLIVTSELILPSFYAVPYFIRVLDVVTRYSVSVRIKYWWLTKPWFAVLLLAVSLVIQFGCVLVVGGVQQRSVRGDYEVAMTRCKFFGDAEPIAVYMVVCLIGCLALAHSALAFGVGDDFGVLKEVIEMATFHTVFAGIPSLVYMFLILYVPKVAEFESRGWLPYWIFHVFGVVVTFLRTGPSFIAAIRGAMATNSNSLMGVSKRVSSMESPSRNRRSSLAQTVMKSVRYLFSRTMGQKGSSEDDGDFEVEDDDIGSRTIEDILVGVCKTHIIPTIKSLAPKEFAAKPVLAAQVALGTWMSRPKLCDLDLLDSVKRAAESATNLSDTWTTSSLLQHSGALLLLRAAANRQLSPELIDFAVSVFEYRAVAAHLHRAIHSHTPNPCSPHILTKPMMLFPELIAALGLDQLPPTTPQTQPPTTPLSGHRLQLLASKIYELYLASGAPYEVNLSHSCREATIHALHLLFDLNIPKTSLHKHPLESKPILSVAQTLVQQPSKYIQTPPPTKKIPSERASIAATITPSQVDIDPPTTEEVVAAISELASVFDMALDQIAILIDRNITRKFLVSAHGKKLVVFSLALISQKYTTDAENP